MLLSSIPLSVHESAMRVAMQEGRQNESYPFGAVIVDANTSKILAKGVNAASSNPTLHGEISCMNNYVKQHGNRNWPSLIIYTTGEPCSMCMTALVWAGIGGVVYASSIDSLVNAGIKQVRIAAKDVIAASDFWRPALLGGVLERECDAMFMGRRVRLR